MRRAWLFSFRRRYGASPLHLASHLAALAIIAFIFERIIGGGTVLKLLVLYLGFVIAHDLIFVPAYSGLDRFTRRALARRSLSGRSAVPVINYVRAPALISALLLIIYGPLISGVADGEYFAVTGHHLEHYLGNWVLITGGLFLGSGVFYLLRVSRQQRQRKAVPAESD